MKINSAISGSQVFRPEHFINRELSWLEFNARVLEEAQDAKNPLIERLKFLAIFSSNLDEFFMVRVAGLRDQAFSGSTPQDITPDGLKPIEQLTQIAIQTRRLVAEQYRCWNDSVRPALAEHGIRIVAVQDLKKPQVELIDSFFKTRAFAVLTPMAIDPSHPSPRFHNRGLYIAAKLKRVHGLGPSEMLAVVQVPQVLPRFIEVSPQNGDREFVTLEDIIAARLDELFGGYETIDHATFRVTRDMDIELLEHESDNILQLIEARIRARQRTDAVRLEINSGINPQLLDVLVKEESLHTRGSSQAKEYSEVYHVDGMLDMTSLFELTKLKGFDDLRDRPFTQTKPEGMRRTSDLFATIADHDVLLHHPFESFDPVIDFVEKAAEDPNVLAIKQTLYRTSGDSPIIRALMLAAENGKQVTALVELKARFDESNNITWARELERAGVHVVFGFMDLKTHCKTALVVRQEGDDLKRYVHLSTGNYNPITAKLYTDIGLMTADPVIADDATALFNLLTGYSQSHKWKKLILAPRDLRDRTLDLIAQQTARAHRGRPAKIIAKLNSLVDRTTIEALYRASQAGVTIDLIIRGICCLRPGLPGVSENIRVRSVVDRFLEHSRILVFGEGKKAHIYLSSADWMPRNFDRRVEVMFPIEDKVNRDRILNEILPAYFEDNTKARILKSDGYYYRLKETNGAKESRSQYSLLGDSLIDLNKLGHSENSYNENGADRKSISRIRKKEKKKSIKPKH